MSCHFELYTDVLSLVVQKAKYMYTGAGQGPIGYQKPACPLTGNLFMDECGKDKGTCDHDVDVFVQCACKSHAISSIMFLGCYNFLSPLGAYLKSV